MSLVRLAFVGCSALLLLCMTSLAVQARNTSGQAPAPLREILGTPQRQTGIDPKAGQGSLAGAPGREQLTVRAGRVAPIPGINPAIRSMPQTAFGIGQRWNGNPLPRPSGCQQAYTNVGGQPSRDASLYTVMGHHACTSQ